MRASVTLGQPRSPRTRSAHGGFKLNIYFAGKMQAVLMGLEESLRRDLSGTLSDQLDKQVLVGGGGANFGGFPCQPRHKVVWPHEATLRRWWTSPLPPPNSRSASTVNMQVDYLRSCAVVGDDTARKLATVFQTNDSDSALAYATRVTKKTMASANVPGPTNANFQEGILARVGAEGMNAVSPVWSGLTMIRDEVSQTLRKQGQISVTSIMLAGFDILRADGFARTKFKVAA